MHAVFGGFFAVCPAEVSARERSAAAAVAVAAADHAAAKLMEQLVSACPPQLARLPAQSKHVCIWIPAARCSCRHDAVLHIRI